MPTIKTSLRPKDFSDSGAAERFAEQVQSCLRWCNSLGWLAWDGKRWAEDEHEATRKAMAFADQMREDALEAYRTSVSYDDNGKPTVPSDVAEYFRFGAKIRNANAISAFMSLAKPMLAVKAEELDSDWWILNTEAGMVDLRTGKVKPHDPAALCTKIAPYSPTTDPASMSMWDQQMKLVTDDDQEYQRYLQVKAGSYAFGKIFREGFDCAVGGGRNGKSTIYNALCIVLGDYAGVIDSSVLTTERQNRGAELATLRGKRLVIAGELEEGTRMSVATVKRITSTDKIKVEKKYRDPEEITPSHHIVLFSNYLPRVGSTDAGTWRRIEVLPFTATMPEGGGDIPNYAQELADKAGGAILGWIIKGAKMFADAGYRFTPPRSVLQATTEYKAKEDWLAGFIAECCLKDDSRRIKAGDLYNRYLAYAKGTGEYCRRSNDFYTAMQSAGFTQSIINGKKFWRGLDIDFSHPYYTNQYEQSKQYSRYV